MWSPPWFCLFFLPGSSQARSPGLSGNLPCDIWLPALCQKVKGGPGAHFMEMQKATATHNIQQHHDFFSGSLDGVGAFGCTRQAAAHQQLAQVETFERTFPRRSKQQNPKFPMSKKIFPWMKESRHSEQKHGRRIAGLYDKEQAASVSKWGLFICVSSNQLSYAVNGGKLVYSFSFSGSRGQAAINKATVRQEEKHTLAQLFSILRDKQSFIIAVF